jgi:hypothetical protein
VLAALRSRCASFVRTSLPRRYQRISRCASFCFTRPTGGGSSALASRLQLPIPVGVDLLLMPGELVLRRDIPDDAVQTNVVLMLYVTLKPDIAHLPATAARQGGFESCSRTVSAKLQIVAPIPQTEFTPLHRLVMQTSIFPVSQSFEACDGNAPPLAQRSSIRSMQLPTIERHIRVWAPHGLMCQRYRTYIFTRTAGYILRLCGGQERSMTNQCKQRQSSFRTIDRYRIA